MKIVPSIWPVPSFVAFFASDLMIYATLAGESSQGMADQITQAVSGEYTDSTAWYWVVGAVACFAGSFLLLVRLR